MRKLNGFDWVTLILLIIGGLNWLLIGLFGFNLVDQIFGAGSVLSTIVYLLVGLSAIYILAISGKLAKQ